MPSYGPMSRAATTTSTREPADTYSAANSSPPSSARHDPAANRPQRRRRVGHVARGPRTGEGGAPSVTGCGGGATGAVTAAPPAAAAAGAAAAHLRPPSGFRPDSTLIRLTDLLRVDTIPCTSST